MKYLIGLGVATLIIIISAYFWLFSVNGVQTAQERADQAESPLETQSGNKNSDSELTGFGTMKELFQRGTDLECQITTINNSAASEGTFFVADQKIRGDFITTSPDLEDDAMSSIIIIKDTMYVWTEIEGESYGVKSQMQTTANTDIQTHEPVSLDERVKYSCQKWEHIDQSIFIPPSDVMFQDMSTLLQAGMEYGTVYEEGEMPY